LSNGLKIIATQKINSSLQKLKRMSKIFCFINGGNSLGVQVCALSEDGNGLAGHLSSNEGWAKHDIGINSDWKHEKYKEKYPDGYELIWIDMKGELPEDFKQALEIANSKAPAEND
jgi:hypothetical protein